jgi:LysR family nitrogen assimilation transcriptional regulator
MLTLRQLRYFVAIGEHGALSHAAQTLNIVQSALSHHLAQLEAELGVQLIERRARGIVLTPAGQRLYQHACSIISSTLKAEEDVRTFSERLEGSVTIGLAHTAAAIGSLPLMQAVRLTYPGILTIQEGLSINLTRSVLSGEVDIALVYNPQEDSRLDLLPLLKEQMYLVGRAELIGADSSPVRFSEMPQHPVLGPNMPSALRAIIDSSVLRSRIKPSEVLKIDSLTAMTLALENGMGWSILARASVRDSLAANRLHARRIIEPEVNRMLALASLSDRPKTRSFEAMQKLLAGVISAEVKEGRWPD